MPYWEVVYIVGTATGAAYRAGPANPQPGNPQLARMFAAARAMPDFADGLQFGQAITLPFRFEAQQQDGFHFTNDNNDADDEGDGPDEDEDRLSDYDDDIGGRDDNDDDVDEEDEGNEQYHW